MAAESSSSEQEARLLAAADAGDAAGVGAALEAGADPSCADGEGITPLMKAAESGHADIVMKLLEAGAPWNAQDADGYCAGAPPRRNGHFLQTSGCFNPYMDIPFKLLAPRLLS